METTQKIQSAPVVKPENEKLPDTLRIDDIPAPTKGEEKVHKFAHKTINFWLNYAISLVITDLFLGHTERKLNQVTSIIAEKSGSKSVQRASDWLHNMTERGRDGIKFGLEKTGMSKQVRETVAHTAMDIFTLMMGGHITSSIATYILNRSDVYAKKYDEADDKKRGYTPSPEELAAREARYEYLRNQPKKSAWTVIKSRILGFGINTVVIGWLTSKMDLRTYYSTPEEMKGKRTGIRSFTQAMGNTAEKFAEKKLGWSAKNQARANYWTELIPFEGLCTFNTALALELVTVDPAKHEKKKESLPATTATSGTHSVRYASSAAVASDEAPPIQEVADTKWSDGKTSKRGEVKARGEIQPHEIRNEALTTQSLA
jgi:hypothetical protein